jgi:hypothetical protein
MAFPLSEAIALCSQCLYKASEGAACQTNGKGSFLKLPF